MRLKSLVIMTLIFLGEGAWANDLAVDSRIWLVKPDISECGASPLPTYAACQNSAITVANQINPLIATCLQSSSKAAYLCLAETSPQIHTGMVIVGGSVSAIATMKNMSDACSKYNKAAQAGQAALAAYSGSCAVVQYKCHKDCHTLKEALDSHKKTSGLIKSVEVASKELSVVIDKCTGYKTSMLAAGAGILSLLQQSGMMGKCEKALTIANCATDPTNPQCPQPLDCTKPANAQNATCICLTNPNSVGCPGAVVSNSVAPTFGTSTPASRLAIDKIDPGQYDGTGGAEQNFISPSSGRAPSGGSLGALAPGGGGSGGSGAGTGTGDKTKAEQKKGLNTNILSGMEGGGGGGGFSGSRSNSSGNSALKAYMPGGSKDPSRNLASKTFGNGEVTAAGSKSNWEKVRERYVENKSTLMSP